MSTAKKEYKRVTVKSLVEMKANNENFNANCLRLYMAKIVDSAGVDVILVKLHNVMAGHEPLPIT